MGTKILRVQASDADSGRNAQIFFFLNSGNVASPVFTIDSPSGEIFTSSDLDYESSSPHLYKLRIVASDNGSPRKSSLAHVYVTIANENDHCPVFNSLPTTFFNISRCTHPGTLLTVVSADDKDSGLNGEVRYSLLFAGYYDGGFQVGEENGRVIVVSQLKQKEYRLLIVARDLGVPSCSRQVELTVNVFGQNQVTEEPSEETTVASTEGNAICLSELLRRDTVTLL